MLTLLTRAAASSETLTDQDYREIYAELAAGKTTRQIAAILGVYSDTWWSQFGRGDKPLTRQARQALRRAVGVAELPPTVAEATAGADPDAAVYQFGPAPANRLLLIGAGAHDTIITINENLHELPPSPVPSVVPGAGAEALLPSPGTPGEGLGVGASHTTLATPVALPASHATCTTQHATPDTRKTLHVSPETHQRFTAARRAAGLTVEQFLAHLLEDFSEWRTP